MATFPKVRLKYTDLNAFETKYQELATQHPDNYGWYQCGFHNAAEKIYENGGVEAMKNLWTALAAQKEVLSNADLQQLIKKHPALDNAVTNWNEN